MPITPDAAAAIKTSVLAAAQTATAEELVYLATALDRISGRTHVFENDELLDTAIRAIKAKVAAVVQTASPEEIVYLSTAIERITGQVTLLTVEETADAKITEIGEAADTAETAAIAAIDAVKTSAVATTQTAAQTAIGQAEAAAQTAIGQAEAAAQTAIGQAEVARDAAIAAVNSYIPPTVDTLIADVAVLRNRNPDPMAPIVITGPISRRVLRETQVAVSGDLEITDIYLIVGGHTVLDVSASDPIVFAEFIEDDIEITTGALVATSGDLALAPWATLTVGSNAIVYTPTFPRTFVV